MKNSVVVYMLAGCFMCCQSISQDKGLLLNKKLPSGLKEVSGIAWHKNTIWAISDKPRPVIFKLNGKGEVQQEIRLLNITVSDVEAITTDGSFLYVGDVGDNRGNRTKRNIYKVALDGLGKTGNSASTKRIQFTFPDMDADGKKKDNDFDCEAMLCYRDSIYLFTKRRTDDRSELYVVAAKEGTYVARFISVFDVKGLVTDAAINSQGTEVILTGYGNGHDAAFVWLLKDFKGSNLFNGSAKRIELSSKKTEWQIEGATFGPDESIYFSCEQTKKVPASLYQVALKNLSAIKNIAD